MHNHRYMCFTSTEHASFLGDSDLQLNIREPLHKTRLLRRESTLLPSQGSNAYDRCRYQGPRFRIRGICCLGSSSICFPATSWDCMEVSPLSWVLVVGINHLLNVKFLPFRVTSSAASAYFCLGLYRKAKTRTVLTNVTNIYLQWEAKGRCK